MNVFDVLVVGELNVDIILDKILGFPRVGKEIISKEMNLTLGSSSAIFASNLSSFSTEVAFIGKLGNDNFSHLVLQSLTAKKVHTDFIIRSDLLRTGLTVVMNYGNDRANVTYPGAMEHLKESEIEDEMLKKAKHLHVSSVFMQPGLLPDLLKLFERAKKMGLTTSMDPQWDPSEKWELNLPKLLPYVDVFMPNIEEFKYLTNSRDILSGLKAVEPFCNIVVIKDGERGAHLWNKNKLISKPAFINNKIVDCIGAGDSFDAGFISEFVKGHELQRCLEIGNLAGALNTTAHGGTAAFKNMGQIKRQAAENFSFQF
ncbi:sugar kinase [Flavobacteriaceae bacterium F89]|uniref:Sugar kinase n=2 Tax=Cerina litoralis TaxID=2874477 RepID=A0AAE3EVF1_9FLAO|nr:sugar kinase [Cerina litoralis]